jgi:hypothetical protein
VACNEIRSVRLNAPDFGDVIGSYRFDRTGNSVLPSKGSGCRPNTGRSLLR